VTADEREAMLRLITERVIEVGACWEWQRCCRQGVPMIRVQGQSIGARRLVALATGRKVHNMIVSTTCGNQRCVAPEHVRIVRRGTLSAESGAKRNTGAAFRAKLQASIQSRGRARLNHELAAEVRRRYDAGNISQRALAREYGVSQYVIGRAVAGLTWRRWDGVFGNLIAGLVVGGR
jgi:hypothetical protein